VRALSPSITTLSMEMEYGDYLSIEQMSRELFVSYGTIKSWLNNRQINADVNHFSANTLI